ncbi:MAG: hypothetical protein JWN23_1565 [Rhodocyclales bacterium]|nr:hypothetical protein [Rhodocyclales bacterium]
MKHLIYPLNHPSSRARAAMAVNDAPDGWVVEVRPPPVVPKVTAVQLDWIELLRRPPLPPAPRCFDSDADWQRWCQESRASDWPLDRFCRDCNLQTRDAMIGAGRCVYPETVFVVLRGEDMVGLRRDDPGWYGAMTGKYLGSGKRAASQTITSASREAFESKEAKGVS